MNLMSVPKCWLIIAELEFSMRLQVIRRKTFPFVVKTSPFNTSFEGKNHIDEEIFGFFSVFLHYLLERQNNRHWLEPKSSATD